MQTVNFNCPHCGNLMAVGTNLLGRNVRCPHCKQVVRAPAAAGEAPVQAPVPTPAPPPQAPAPPPVPSPTFNIPQPTEHHESIFGERHDEDVFGSEPMKPTFAPLPSAPLPPTIQDVVPPPQPISQPPPLHEPLAFDAPTVTAMSSLPMPPDPYEDRAADRPPPRDVEARNSGGYAARPRREEAQGTPAFAWILLIYAVIITIAAGFFGYQYFSGDSKGEHPFKAMPDVIRQYDPAKKPQTAFQNMPDPKQEVPADLRVRLGGEITVGDLKVQPISVEKKIPLAVTKYKSAADDKSRSLGDRPTLVLTLRVKNMSNDTTFDPNDPAFVRAFQASQPAPYTALQIDQNFFYGTFKWPSDPEIEREYFEGQEREEKPLRPGEERDTYVTLAPPGARSSGSLDVQTKLGEMKPNGPLLWRVQLRRGMANFQDGDKTVSLSATTVIGVEFQKDQIK